MTKRIFFLLAAFLLLGGMAAVTAQNRPGERRSIIYYTPKQHSHSSTVWIDDIRFGPRRTVVTMHYLRARGGANLSPSTRLICHLKGGRTRVLTLQATRGISMTKDRYTQLGRGEVFQACFPALPPAETAKIKRVDFMEDPSGLAGGNVFNITGVKINKKHCVIR